MVDYDANGTMFALLANKAYLYTTREHCFVPMNLKHIGRTSLLFLALALPLHSQDSKEDSEFNLAVKLYNDGMYDLALQQFSAMAASDRTSARSVESQFYTGLIQMKLEKFEEAKNTFQNFALSNLDHPKSAEAWMKVGEAYAALNDFSEAASAFERLKTFHPKDPSTPEALLRASEYYRLSGRHDDASRVLRAILQQYGGSRWSHSARIEMGRIYLEEGRFRQAEDEARRVLESVVEDEVRAEAMFLIGSVKFKESLFSEAEEEFRSAIIRFPKSAGARRSALFLGDVLSGEKNFGGAAELFEKAIASTTGDTLTALARIGLARTLIMTGKHSAALRQLDEVIAAHPETRFAEDALLLSGFSGMQRAKPVEAAVSYRKILDMKDPSREREALLALARAEHSMDNHFEAILAYQSFAKQFPDDPATPEILYTIGTTLSDSLGDCRKSLSIFDEVRFRFPASHFAPKAIERKASCEESIGSEESALASLELLVTDYPGVEAAQRFSKRMEYVRHHSIKNRDEAFEKLAGVLGSMILNRPGPDLALALADIYFHDLKKYDDAAEQFAHALSAQLEGRKAAEAAYWRARSLHLQSEIDNSRKKEAIAAYEGFLKTHATDTLAPHAAAGWFELAADNLSEEELFSVSAEILAKPIAPEERKNVLYLASTAGVVQSKSRPPAYSPRRMEFVNQLGEEFPKSPMAQDALVTAAMYVRGNDSVAALLERAATLQPNGLHTRSIEERLVMMYDTLGKESKAVKHLDHLLEHFPYAVSTDPDFLASATSVFLKAGKIGEALDLVTGALRRAPSGESVSLHPILARIHLAGGNTVEARRELAKFLRSRREGTEAQEAYFTLGSIAREAGETDLAKSYFKSAGGMESNASPELADALYSNEQYESAAKHYLRLSTSSTDSSAREHAFRRAILSHIKLGKTDAAVNMMTEYKRKFPKSPESEAAFEYEFGMSSFKDQFYPQAAKRFEKVAGSYGKTSFGPWARYHIGKIAEVEGKLEDAAKHYQRILENDSTSDVIPRVLLSLGNMHFNVERYEEAIRNYQLITERPDLAGDILPYAMNNLIEAYESIKLFDAALKVTREFIERYPSDESIMSKKIKIGTLYSKIGYFDQAISHFETILPEVGGSLEAELRYNIGETYYYKGDYQRAILEFLKVPYLVTQQGKVDWTATSLYMAGQAYERMSKFPEAVGMYQQIVDRTGIDPTFKGAARKEIERVTAMTKKGPR